MSDTTGPLTVPAGGHYPAGWISPEAAEHAQRQAVAWELAQEEEAARRAARDNLISERIASRRAAGAAQVVRETAVAAVVVEDPVSE